MADSIIGRIRAIITGDSSGLTVATDKAEKSLKDLGKQAKKTSAETSTAMGKMADAVGTAFATAAVVQFAKASVTAAGDTAEAVNATRVIFGSASATIEKFAETAATSLGASRKQALDAANTFATFGKSAGLTGDELSKFAIDMVRLSSDFASFRNTTPEDAIMAVGAALRGETEPIRRYGILLNDMTLRQEALRMGLIQTTKEALSPQAKVLAAQAAILKQSSDAQGDFARTSDSLSNQQKILSAQFKDLQENVGQALVPAVRTLLNLLNPLLSLFNNMSAASRNLVSTVGLLAAGLALAKRQLANFGYEMKNAEGGTTKLGKALGMFGKALAGIGIAEGIMATFNAISDNAGNLDRKLQGVIVSAEKGSGALTAAFANLVAAEGKGMSLGNIVADFGKEFAIAGQGSARNVEEIDRAFKKVLETSPQLAQQLIDDWTKQTNLLDKNSNAYQNNIKEINKYQEWTDLATESTEALNEATGNTEAPLKTAADAFAGAAESLEEYRSLILGTALVQKRELAATTNDIIVSTGEFVAKMREGKLSQAEFTNELIGQADTLLELQFATKGQVAALQQVAPTMRYVIESMYRAGEAQGYTRQQTQYLINELGLLDGIDPQIKIFMSMDIEQLRAQAAAIRKQVEALRMDSFSRNAPITRDLIGQLDMIAQIGDALNNVGDFQPTRGGGGGGSRDKAFDWVKDWVKDIAAFVEKVIDRDFKKQLIDSSADDIANALSDLVKEATEKGISLLDGGFAVDLINKVSLQLQAAANQLGGPGGLEERFKAATDKVTDFERALEDLQGRFREFQLAEQGVGSYTTLERLDQELAKLEDLKGRLEDAKRAYSDFKNEGVSALDAQLSRLDDLRANLETLEKGYESLNASIAGDAALSPLERERKQLDALRTSLENVSQARLSYAQSVQQQASQIQYADRGGALLTAQRWLQKVTAFRDVISGLRDRAFPISIIRDVLNAGIDGGTKLGRKLLSLSDTDLAELKKVQQQISSVAAETGEIAASVLFDADVSAAQSAFNRQLSLVQNLYQQAIGQARNEFNAQQAVVESVYQQQIATAQAAVDQQRVIIQALFTTALAEARGELEKARATANTLSTAIQDLRGTMASLIDSIAKAVTAAQNASQQQQQPVQSGSSTTPTGGTIPGTTTPVVTGVGDRGTPTTGQRVGGQDRLWGGPGGGAVVDGIYLGPELGNFFGGARADGGSVMARQSYLVGERGPEIFTPSRNGMIIPNEALIGGGGAATYNITVNAKGDPSEVGRQVVRAIQEYERRNGTSWRS